MQEILQTWNINSVTDTEQEYIYLHFASFMRGRKCFPFAGQTF